MYTIYNTYIIHIIIGVYIYIYLLPLEPPAPVYSTPLDGHKAPGWSPCVTEQLPASYLFHI